MHCLYLPRSLYFNGSVSRNVKMKMNAPPFFLLNHCSRATYLDHGEIFHRPFLPAASAVACCCKLLFTLLLGISHEAVRHSKEITKDITKESNK